MTRRSAIWSITAVLGIVCAAAIAWAASQLAGQHIGLASDPLSVARGLAPSDREPATPSGPARRPPDYHVRKARVTRSRPSNTATASPAVTLLVPAVTAATQPAAQPAVTTPGSPPAASGTPIKNRAGRSGQQTTSGASSAPQQPGADGGGDRPDDNGGQSGGGGGSGAKHPDD